MHVLLRESKRVVLILLSIFPSLFESLILSNPRSVPKPKLPTSFRILEQPCDPWSCLMKFSTESPLYLSLISQSQRQRDINKAAQAHTTTRITHIQHQTTSVYATRHASLEMSTTYHDGQAIDQPSVSTVTQQHLPKFITPKDQPTVSFGSRHDNWTWRSPRSKEHWWSSS